MTSSQNNAITALRTAADALEAGRAAAGGGNVDSSDKHTLNSEVAHVIEQLSSLLRAAGALDASDNSPGASNLLAVNHHLTAASELACRGSKASGLDTPPQGDTSSGP